MYNDKILKLNKKINRLKKFNKNGKDLCNKTFFTILGLNVCTMLLPMVFSTIGAYINIGMMLFMFVAGVANSFVQFTDYEKKIDKLSLKLDKLIEEEQIKAANLEKAKIKELNINSNDQNNIGFSRTKAMKVYADKVAGQQKTDKKDNANKQEKSEKQKEQKDSLANLFDSCM